jgi:hypothetical protein
MLSAAAALYVCAALVFTVWFVKRIERDVETTAIDTARLRREARG